MCVISQLYFYISGIQYSFISGQRPCVHKHAYPIWVLYNCVQYSKSATAKCEQHCSNWATCIGYSVENQNSDHPKCRLYPSQPGSCPSKEWHLSASDLPIARNKDDLRPNPSPVPGYCKYKHGINWQDVFQSYI